MPKTMLLRSDLPVPVALFVGNLSERTELPGAAMAARSWARIREAYDMLAPRGGRSERPFGDPPSIDDVPGRTAALDVRRAARALLPIAVNDCGNADDLAFQARLRRYFVAFDVWGVIAGTTAQNTPGILAALDAVNVPVLLVLDTVVGVRDLAVPANVLRLVPHNELQAQTIVATLAQWNELAEGRVTGALYRNPPGGRYVEDLARAVHHQAGHHPTCPPVIDVQRYMDVRQLREPRAMVWIGYAPENMERFDKVARACQYVLCSDGFGVDRQWRGTAHVPAQAFVRPSIAPDRLAQDAFTALCGVWTRVGRDHGSWANPGVSAAERVQPVSHLLRGALESGFGEAYSFQGQNNVRGGYVVVRREHEHAQRQHSECDPEHDQQLTNAQPA